MCNIVHSVHNEINKKWKKIQPPISSRKYKQNVVYPYNGVLFCRKKKSSTTWKKLETIMLSETKEQYYYDPVWKYPEETLTLTLSIVRNVQKCLSLKQHGLMVPKASEERGMECDC